MREWSNQNHPAHLRVMNQKSRLTGTRDKPTIPRNREARNLYIKLTPEPETETGFQGWCTDLEGYTFDLGPISSGKFARKMKELERYLGTAYSDSCHT